jgi:hypothetical protein
VTSISVNGKAHHYFHSEALGNCRAIIISDAENLPSPAAEKSHASMVNDEIDIYEQELAKKVKKPQKNTLSKGDKLDMLMNCSARLQSRIDRYFKNYQEASDRDSRDYWWDRMRSAEKANTRVIHKIGLLFVASQL